VSCDDRGGAQREPQAAWPSVIEEMAAALVRGQMLARPYRDYLAAQQWLQAQPWTGQVWPHLAMRAATQELHRLVWWRATAHGRSFPRPARLNIFQDDNVWPKDEQEIQFSQQMLANLSRLQSVAGGFDHVLDRFEEALFGEQWRWDIQHPHTMEGYPSLDLHDFPAVRHEVLCRAGHELWLEITGWEIWHEDRHRGVSFLRSKRKAGDAAGGQPLDRAALDELLERAAQLPVALDRLEARWPSFMAARRACRPLPEDLPVWLVRLIETGADDMFKLHWPGVPDEPATRLEQLSIAYVASFGTGGEPWWLEGWRLLAKHRMAAAPSLNRDRP
jgi:hypothetical protein